MKKRLSIISLTLAAMCLAAVPALAATPTDYVRGILDKVIGIQNDPALTEASRRPLIHKIIEQSFDFPMMARDSLGSAYGSLSAGQRREFLEVFSYLFQDSYTRLVLNFLKKENIDYKKERKQGDKAQVDTAIVRPNESIPVTYFMHSAPGGWILYDVVVDEVSILENYRKEFSQVIRTKGYPYLLEKMKTQSRALK
jgi:phospholipid transport system substrate-binding protein